MGKTRKEKAHLELMLVSMMSTIKNLFKNNNSRRYSKEYIGQIFDDDGFFSLVASG